MRLPTSSLFLVLWTALLVAASGLAIGMCGACGVQDSCRQPKLYIGMVLIWSFGSALGAHTHPPPARTTQLL